jgi:hypothetical protein
MAIAQPLFIECNDNVNPTTGAVTEVCLYNTSSPLMYLTTSGSTVRFGTESYVYTECVSNMTKSPETCSCSVVVNPNDPIISSDYCNSCDIQILTDTKFLPYFDCSNRLLVGDCVGFDTNGACIESSSSGSSFLKESILVSIGLVLMMMNWFIG